MWRSGGILVGDILNLGGGGEWPASFPCNFAVKERYPGSLWLEYWMGPRGGLDAVKKRKSLAPARNRTRISQSDSCQSLY
jgi:hypothetical protein